MLMQLPEFIGLNSNPPFLIRKGAGRLYMLMILIVCFGACGTTEDSGEASAIQHFLQDIPDAPQADPGDSPDLQEQWKRIATKYVQEKYEQAAFLLESMLADPALSDDVALKAAYYLGVCNMAAKNYPNAVIYFDELVIRDEAWSQESEWYLALIALETEDYELAYGLLASIARQDAHPRKAEAEILLQSLE
jgi:outer membrane PBP1 activator LpoA protein